MRSFSVVTEVLGLSTLIASLALATSGCGGTTCSTSDECSDAEYCPLEEGACLLPTRAERSCTDRPAECPDVYTPVCGCDGKSYDSACEAAVQGVSVAAQGLCVTTCDKCGKGEVCNSEAGACGQGTACLARPEKCPPVEASVCGCDGKTYTSECEAAKAGQTVFAEGPCETPVQEVECGGPAQVACPEGYFCEIALGTCFDVDPVGACRIVPEECPDLRDPVCGCDGQTYGSSCEAALAGVALISEGACPCGPGLATCDGGSFCDFPLGTCIEAQAVGACAAVPESCPGVVTPVCGCDGRTYDNACLAAAASVSVAAEGACACGPGLAECGEGSFCNFPLGTCADAEPRGVCATLPTDCPSVLEPVCGCDGDTYDSLCEAAAAGVSVVAEGGCPCGPGIASCPNGSFCEYLPGECGNPQPVGVCSPVPDDCPNVVVPVCGCDGLDYDSACEAAREGLSIRVVGPCDPTP